MKTKEIKKTGNPHLAVRGHRKAILYPCPWQRNGCDKKLKTSDLLKHSRECSANPARGLVIVRPEEELAVQNKSSLPIDIIQRIR